MSQQLSTFQHGATRFRVSESIDTLHRVVVMRVLDVLDSFTFVFYILLLQDNKIGGNLQILSAIRFIIL